jgi:hypothetical protein
MLRYEGLNSEFQENSEHIGWQWFLHLKEAWWQKTLGFSMGFKRHLQKDCDE